ncbi:translation elongation factor Ts [Candidatus Neptunochlamydia vexilliferae]|uniref:Elongation factor Ts n=1 Tax=Candidatus Neptunichlamydia vexilliferae TaxID=1651774 RepID=A0ABS0B0G2_9BACT|nr:translation elongation factor Ts [Candidatus Neptunochlamydia vexilliferae]MBF5059882.1 Elongation factor Ts [Candidatus Neptunochlamydia vexilliferae]
MTISAQMVMDLRKRTGVGMSKCKDALTEAGGDMEEAISILRKKGMASAVKKGGRETNEGVVGVAENSEVAYLVEVNVETDFVLQNDRFKEFLKNICDDALVSKPSSVEDFLQQKYSKNSALTIDEYRAETVHSLGENIQIKRLLDFKKSGDESLGIYSHMGGKIVCAVRIAGAGDQEALARDVAMHVAAEAPDYLKPEEIPADVLAKEEEIARSQIQGKPPEIMDKIVQGKLNAYKEQVCLLNQKFVKDSSSTVANYVVAEGKKAGKTLEVVEFVRWQIGE